MAAVEEDGHATGRPAPKKEGITRVWVDGCFDTMHFGHGNLLRQARTFGDELYVGIHTDEEVFTFKGSYPVMTDEERYLAARACKWVTAVVEGAPYVTTIEDMRKYDIDIVIHGDDVSVDLDGNDSYAEIRKAGMFRTVRRTEGISTTDLVGRMLLLTREHHHKTDDPEAALDAERTSDFSGGDRSRSDSFSGAGMSKFVATSRKLVQFSNNTGPTPEDKVVYVDGDFDLFHPGHIAFLKAARALGTYLIVGVHMDRVVNQNKGKNYPIMNLNERVLGVLACRYTDECVIGVPYEVTADLLSGTGCHVVAAGHPGTRTAVRGSDPYQLPKERGIFVEIASGSECTTDKIIQRIIRNRLELEERNRVKEEKDKHLNETAFKVAEIG